MRWTDSDLLILKEKYPTTNTRELATLLNRDFSAVRSQAENLKLKKTSLYKINHDFFESWSSDMAYILGFIITDGCISENRLSFGVASKDKCVLQYISDCITPGKPVSDYEESRNGTRLNISRLKIRSDTIIQSLYRFHVIPRKTGYEKLPDYIPECYKPDLLRGIFDGDGCINFSNPHYCQLHFSICSANEKFLYDIKSRLLFNYGYIHLKSFGKKANMYVLHVYKKGHIRDIANYMYSKSGQFCLERKRSKFYE